MCCRYTLQNLEALAELCRWLGLDPEPAGFTARYNVALTQRMPVIVHRGRPELAALAFGVTLPSARTGARPVRMANARADTLLTRPAFREAARHRRCLVPADGFYEWERQGRARLPHYFYLREHRPFFFGGIWQPASATAPAAFAIVTTGPNDLMRPVHDRMPVLLGPNSGPRWLGDAPLEPVLLARLCRPLSAARMDSHRVDPRMNSARYEAPDCAASFSG